MANRVGRAGNEKLVVTALMVGVVRPTDWLHGSCLITTVSLAGVEITQETHFSVLPGERFISVVDD